MAGLHFTGEPSPGRRWPGPAVPFPVLRRALRVLEAVAGHRGGVSEDLLVRETGLPPWRLVRVLRTLRREDYVRRLPDGTYAVGEALALLLGTGAGGADAREQALGERLGRLRDSVGAAVYLGRYRDGEMEIVHCADSPCYPAVNEWVDFRSAVHATAMGKCLLSQLDHEGRRDHFSRHRTARLTSRTITDEKALLEALERQPPTVPVLDIQEYAVGTVCAAVPITAGSAAGCLALSLPVEHTHRLRRAAEALNAQAAPLLLALSL